MFVLGYALFLVFNVFSVQSQQEDSDSFIAMLALQFAILFFLLFIDKIVMYYISETENKCLTCMS